MSTHASSSTDPQYTPSHKGKDKITLSKLTIHLAHGLGPSAFSLLPAPPCPAILTLDINLYDDSVSQSAVGDSMSNLGVNYSAVCKEIYAALSSSTRTFQNAWELLEIASSIPLKLNDVESVDIKVELPRATLHALGVVYKGIYSRQGIKDKSCEIRNIQCSCVVGLHPHERGEKQRLEVDVRVEDFDWDRWNHKIMTDQILRFIEESSYGTIESLAHFLTKYLVHSSVFANDSNEPTIELTIRKPSAIPFATPSISITRSRADYSDTTLQAETEVPLPSGRGNGNRVFIAVGSNIGDSVSHIRHAISALERGGCKLVGCSRLYESVPMYVEDQERFTNGAIEVTTDLQPMDLLRLLKKTERAVGRTKTYTNGPRVIDLDLVFYGNQVIRIGDKTNEEDVDGIKWLECPHASLIEREFVLRPLADIAPEFKHPLLGFTIRQMLNNLPKSNPPALGVIIPFSGPSRPIRLSKPSTPHIMAIFNATPDSFSDGDPSRTDLTKAIKLCEKLMEGSYPPTILDIGGMSTRPNSKPCSEEEEISRVIPLIKSIRSSTNEKLAKVAISIDTYRPEVARKAIEVGANCINDVRGGRENGMLELMAELDVPVILMHSRGDSTSMTSDELKDYTKQGGVVNGVIDELKEMVEEASKKGVKKWNIIIDPGIGFAKTQEGNLLLLKNLSSFVNNDELGKYPLLVGSSRKGFIGNIIDRPIAKERGYGDAAINALCVASGVVDVLRVHEPKEAAETVKMALAIRDVE